MAQWLEWSTKNCQVLGSISVTDRLSLIFRIRRQKRNAAGVVEVDNGLYKNTGNEQYELITAPVQEAGCELYYNWHLPGNDLTHRRSKGKQL